uniref:Uncharacterized protein n=1 Tax=Caenorhabditis tropicalis TaxID=1561998 RepID=A0A1I7SYD9_9PELO
MKCVSSFMNMRKEAQEARQKSKLWEETANDGSDLPLNSLDVPIRDVDKDSHEEKKQLLNNEQRIVFDTVISAVHDEKLIL